MSDNQEIFVKDACVFIDLFDIGLVDLFFQLNLTVVTTSLVQKEILETEQQKKITSFIESGVLSIDDSGETETIKNLRNEFKGLSIPDCSVLELALRKKAIILSSDGPLRKISVRNDLMVRGVIWVIERLNIQGLLNTQQCLSALDIYETSNARAPKKEIDILRTHLLKTMKP